MIVSDLSLNVSTRVPSDNSKVAQINDEKYWFTDDGAGFLVWTYGEVLEADCNPCEWICR
jgi:hypothetical protein